MLLLYYRLPSLIMTFSLQIAQDTSNAFERLVSRTIFWSYCIVAPPIMVGYTLVAILIAKL